MQGMCPALTLSKPSVHVYMVYGALNKAGTGFSSLEAVTWRPPGQKKLHAQSWAAQWWTGGQWRRHPCFLRRAACWLPAGIHITYKGPCLHLRLSGPSNVLMKRDCMHMPASQG